MKYLHNPKKSSICCYFVFLTIFLLLNVCFFWAVNSASSFKNDFIYLAHTFLPICYVIIIALTFSYVLRCLEKIYSLVSLSFQLVMVRILRIVDIVLGIFLIIFFQEGMDARAEINSIIEAIYFEGSNIDFAFVNKMYNHWGNLLLILLIVLAIILFVFAARKGRICKEIKQKIMMLEATEELKKEIDDYLGFDYETSDFYQQTKIPYQELRAGDGTQGEFEAYRQLTKLELSGISYVFNREIPKRDGLLTEIDMILLHKKGIIVLENKQYSTQIYGRATDCDLTIIDHSGQKKSIYNPVKQNEKHVDALREYLIGKGLYTDGIPLHSVVTFTDLKSHQSDEIISRIEGVEETKTTICTSQNLCLVVEKLLQNEKADFFVEIEKIKKELQSLPVRKKW